MNYQDYLAHFERVIQSKPEDELYSDPRYLNFAKLNYARIKRWHKTMQLNEELVAGIKAFTSIQQWIIIVEPWCGDAAPLLPFVVRLSELNPLIQLDIQLRDTEPYLINSYLTNGKKSIPKLIIRDAAGKDLFIYGSRPKAAQDLVNELKAEDIGEDLWHIALQHWYNEDKGNDFQNQLLEFCRRNLFISAAN